MAVSVAASRSAGPTSAGAAPRRRRLRGSRCAPARATHSTSRASRRAASRCRALKPFDMPLILSVSRPRARTGAGPASPRRRRRACFDRSGSFTFGRSIFLCGISFSRCAMMLRRARFLSSDLTMCQGDQRRVGDLEHRIARPRVLVPLGARRQVHVAQLPLPQRIVDAGLESPLLLLVADLEPELDEDDAAVDDVLLERRAAASRKRSYCSSVQKPITRSTPARLYQLRSKITISPAAGKCCMYRCMYIWRLLAVGRRRQRDEAEDARARRAR